MAKKLKLKSIHDMKETLKSEKKITKINFDLRCHNTDSVHLFQCYHSRDNLNRRSKAAHLRVLKKFEYRQQVIPTE